MSEISSKNPISIENLLNETKTVLEKVGKGDDRANIATLERISKSFQAVDAHSLDPSQIKKLEESKVQDQIAHTLDFLQDTGEGAIQSSIQLAIEMVKKEIQSLGKKVQIERKSSPEFSSDSET